MPSQPAVTVAELLDGLAEPARQLLGEPAARAFLARVRRRAPEAVRLVDRLYGGDGDVGPLAASLLDVVLDAAAGRPAALRDLDAERERDPGWFLRPEMIGYVCYADRFAGTLRGIREHLDYLRELGVTYLHLMPLLATRDGADDGGYAVSDYDAVNPRLGDMADLSRLADDLHRCGIALCVDLVINHTAREHEWARRAVAGSLVYRDYYRVFPDRSAPDEYEKSLPDIFPELSPGNFTFVPELRGWVWTTFREFQWDLNYANPAVFRSMLATMLRLANRGPDVLRIDAAPFLWKRRGTASMDQPEAHLLLRAFRAFTAMAAPGVLLKAEAMLGPDAVGKYLGDHRTLHHGAAEGGRSEGAPGEDEPDGYVAECELAYDNQLMVMLWASTALRDTRLARQSLGRRGSPPPGTSWVTYLRCHDDIGWLVDDADAAAVGFAGRAVRSRVSDFYAGAVTGSFSRGARFQLSPEGAHPISGTAASLCGVQDAVERGDPGLLATALRRLEALYSVVFSFGGIPLIYMGDELALVNDAGWAGDPAHATDNRWMHRPIMDWGAAAARYDTSTVAGAAYARLSGLARARRRIRALDAGAPITVLPAPPTLLAYRRGGQGEFLAVLNVGQAPATISLDLLRLAGITTPWVIAQSTPASPDAPIPSDVPGTSNARASSAASVIPAVPDTAAAPGTGLSVTPSGFIWVRERVPSTRLAG